METPTPFDLNEAIRRWQQQLDASPALSADNHEELESHLRASVQRLKDAGLSEEEAFLIAARRIGDHGLLEQEFAKVNSGSVWLTRAIWMLAGILVMNICGSLAAAASWFTLFCTQHILANGTASGVLMAVSDWVAEGLLIMMLYRLAIHKQKPLTQWFHRCLNWPLLAILGLVLLMVAVTTLNMVCVRLGISNLRGPTMPYYSNAFRAASLIFVPIALVLLARRRQKNLAATTFPR
jgi:uncharacterized protein YjiS (DUF1127 family)